MARFRVPRAGADRFVQPCAVDQRALLEVDGHLFAAAAQFEAIELSPVAPLGVCVSAAREPEQDCVDGAGTKVVSDLTNVLALECARRLIEDGCGRSAEAGYAVTPLPPARRRPASGRRGPRRRIAPWLRAALW